MTFPQPSAQKNIAIIGAGPAGLFAAEYLAKKNYRIHLFDQMAKPGRKFLMAGRSGLNLTHSENLEHFLSRYGAARPFLEDSLHDFTPQDLQKWAESLGENCFIGSSGRVFLENFKASPLLRAWLKRLSELHVHFYPKYCLQKIEEHRLTFSTENGEKEFTPDATLLALGGASWKRLGSDGKWAHLFPQECAPFEPSNCGFTPAYFEELLAHYEGEILHDVTLSFQEHTARGGLILTKRGFEGAPLYALSAPLREALKQGDVVAALNLRPSLSYEKSEARLKAQRPRESRSNKLRKAFKLEKLPREMLRLFAPHAQNPAELAQAITSLPLRFTQTAPIDHAISTAGGLKWDYLKNFKLKNHAALFACGEMLDWEAPTGGYLLQACFSTGKAAAKSLHHFLSHTSSHSPSHT